MDTYRPEDTPPFRKGDKVRIHNKGEIRRVRDVTRDTKFISGWTVTLENGDTLDSSIFHRVWEEEGGGGE